MRRFDPAPLYRASVGFDRMADMLDRAMATDLQAPSYPPYNIQKTAENAYRISIAVAGFSPDDLAVEVRENALVVTGRSSEETDTREYLHRGIARRAFERRFQLADHVRVKGAMHRDGMLHVDLLRELPEMLKPRQIEIIRADERLVEDKSGQSQTVG
ncbi:MAG: Hsp20 family protein [Roseinatronobacter sp.]